MLTQEARDYEALQQGVQDLVGMKKKPRKTSIWKIVLSLLIAIVIIFGVAKIVVFGIFDKINKLCKNTNDTISFPESSDGKLDCYQWNIGNFTSQSDLR